MTVTAVLECFGNPLDPALPVRRVANVRWRGVPVRALLNAAGVEARATSVWAQGLDFGRFDGIDCACYLKDLPLDTVAERGIIAYEMNGEPLTGEHGFPARLFVPGYFGTNNLGVGSPRSRWPTGVPSTCSPPASTSALNRAQTCRSRSGILMSPA